MTIEIKGLVVDLSSGSPVHGASIETLIKVRYDAAEFAKTGSDSGGLFTVNFDEPQRQYPGRKAFTGTKRAAAQNTTNQLTQSLD